MRLLSFLDNHEGDKVIYRAREQGIARIQTQCENLSEYTGAFSHLAF